jgi:hypothetical protein
MVADTSRSRPPHGPGRFTAALPIVLIPLVTAVLAVGAWYPRGVNVNVAAAGAAPMAAGPVAYTRSIALNAATATLLEPAAGAPYALAVCNVETPGAEVWIVSPGGTSTAQASGPWGDATTLGAQLPPLGTASAIASSGTPSIRCTFYSQPIGAAVGVGGGGGGGSSVDCVAAGTCLSLDGGDAQQIGTDFGDYLSGGGFTAYQDNDLSDSDYFAALAPGLVQSGVTSIAPTLCAGIGTIAYGALSGATLYACGATTPGTSNGGRPFAGASQLSMSATDAATWNMITNEVGAGISFGDPSSEWARVTVNGIGVGGTPASVYPLALDRAQNAHTIPYVQNSNTGNGAAAIWAAFSDVAAMQFEALSSTYAGSTGGNTNAGAVKVSNTGGTKTINHNTTGSAPFVWVNGTTQTAEWDATDGSFAVPITFTGGLSVTGGVGSVLRGYKTAETSRTSNETAAADPDLAFGGVTAGTYIANAKVLMRTEGFAGQGYKIGIGGTATATSWAGDCVKWESAFGGSNQNRLTAFGATVDESVTAQDLRFDCTGVLVLSGSGTVGVVWAQFASSTDATVVEAGSSLVLERVL